jgi:hypothetical protein
MRRDPVKRMTMSAWNKKYSLRNCYSMGHKNSKDPIPCRYKNSRRRRRRLKLQKINPTSTEARLEPGSCTVEYIQLYMCTLHTNNWASADRVYRFVLLGPSLIVGADILRLLPQPCRKFSLRTKPNGKVRKVYKYRK